MIKSPYDIYQKALQKEYIQRKSLTRKARDLLDRKLANPKYQNAFTSTRLNHEPSYVIPDIMRSYRQFSEYFHNMSEQLWSLSILPFNTRDVCYYLKIGYSFQKWLESSNDIKVVVLCNEVYNFSDEDFYWMLVPLDFFQNYKLTGCHLCDIETYNALKLPKLKREPEKSFERQQYVFLKELKEFYKEEIQEELFTLNSVKQKVSEKVDQGIKVLSEPRTPLREQFLRPEEFEEPTYVSTGQPPGREPWRVFR